MHTTPAPNDSSDPPRVFPITRTVPAPGDCLLPPDIWTKFATTQVDTLIIADDATIMRILNFVWPRLRKPVVYCDSRRFVLPMSSEGTFILRDACNLAARDQQRLSEWWDQRAPHARIIATASHPLHTLIGTSAFSQCLIDHLGSIPLLLTLGPRPAVVVQS